MENKENVLTLKKPIMIDGAETKEINYDFDELTGRDLENVFKESTKSGYMVSASYELDPVIGGRVFAEAANIAYTDVQRFSLADYGKAASLARDFFMLGLVGSQDENI
ncbi:hypothetical protein psyc5s11_44930 [Clostridium gelidum]|uniref:Phage tail assembly protein n=1 Tax=Clostridium gelidum TaxID=704125 RepID=A0ABM7T8X5_9CLOT|nr:phage tail assembly protein [Clostridium gelidum]BCZ48426.1 hypothetical protein psyc5s11_44930 [Clostridium gelidum]